MQIFIINFSQKYANDRNQKNNNNELQHIIFFPSHIFLKNKYVINAKKIKLLKKKKTNKLGM